MENTGTLKSTSTVPPVVARLSHVEAKETSNSRKSLTRVAWLSILLGLLMEVLLASVQFGVVEQLAPFAAELANKLTWAFLVCMVLAIGKGLSKDRALWLGF